MQNFHQNNQYYIDIVPCNGWVSFLELEPLIYLLLLPLQACGMEY